MYVTTFYSFKGGVGRTMALVNAAVTLAHKGRRVLVVDFDVEAPGLDTFDVLRTSDEIPGVIDFTARYIESGQAPNVADYVGECPNLGDEAGKLWIMPSGKSESYATNFNQVDWGELYDRQDGYLLFEDLKAQWQQFIQPDYVLIDSRTGHSDTCGICTRQLPNSVVVFFFPNEQNLRGLTDVVGNIRSEAAEPRNKNIELHFVMSNVPDLDDEDQILEGKINSFQHQLGFRREPIVIHRYDSLSLLNQVVFAKDRPRSRLAKEYGRIVQEISVRNWQDRDGALEYIRRAGKPWRRMRDDSVTSRSDMLMEIESAHAEDGEVLFRLAELMESDGQAESAALLTQQAIDSGYEQPEAFLKRAQVRADYNDRTGAIEDVWRLLESDGVAPPRIREAVGRLVRMEAAVPREIGQSTAVTALDSDDKFWLANSFDSTRAHLPIAVVLWEHILAASELEESVSVAGRHELGMAYMGLGRCSEAARMFRKEGQTIEDMRIVQAFNYGMALWGVNGTPEDSTFQHVVDLDRSASGGRRDANYLQCMAIAYWVLGDSDAAIACVKESQGELSSLRGRLVFSCWRYIEVEATDFEEDLQNILALIDNGNAPTPRFMTEGVSESVQSTMEGPVL